MMLAATGIAKYGVAYMQGWLLKSDHCSDATGPPLLADYRTAFAVHRF